MLLEKSQSPEGWWDRNWFRGEVPNDDDAGTELSVLVATSHTLEWLAIAPAEIVCERQRTERAIRYLTLRTLRETPVQLEQAYGVYTHVGTALQAWVPEVWWELSRVESQH